jgi:hypothetical protein
MRAAMIETDTREEVAQEMEERMQMMDKMYRERLTREVRATIPYLLTRVLTHSFS